MLKKFLSIILSVCVLVLSMGLPVARTYGQTVTPTPTPSSSDSAIWPQPCQDKGYTGQDCVNYLSSTVSDLQGQEKTLSSQIDVMDSQIALTQARIQDTQQKIMNLTLDISTASDKINNLQTSVDSLTKVLLNRIVATYEVGTVQPFQVLVSSSDIKDFFVRENYLKIAQAHDKKLLYDTVQARNDYANQKQIYENEKQQVEALKAQLQAYTDQLDQEKSAKQTLLAQTQGNEASYQRQLSAAQAQLAAFSNFVSTQGGASLLSGQTSCDSWGCYYNQRDSQWGNDVVNGQIHNDCSGPCTVAYIGCLITSVAMLASHYGHQEILPSDIAYSSGSNFAVGTADLAKGTITVKGVNINRNTIASSLSPGLLDSGPVIVGINYGPYGTHFVVIKSYTNGEYIMDDPYIANGHDIPFTDHYSLYNIFEVDRVSI